MTEGPSADDRASATSASPGREVDALERLRAELAEEVDRLPVADRLARFEHANEVLARELASLDEI